MYLLLSMLESALQAMLLKLWKWVAAACLVNTAIAVAGNPVEMAKAFKELSSPEDVLTKQVWVSKLKT